MPAPAPIPADIAACDDCLRELRSPSDRRHRYAFIACAACGPRFSIAEGIPLDRARTTMRAFETCPDCRAESADPGSRRHGDVAVSCPRCGPKVWLQFVRGGRLEGETAIAEAARKLAAGETVAVRGDGGFRLFADARNEAAVGRLRARRQRDRNPFVVLAADPSEASSFARITPVEEGLLRSPARPVVLLPVILPSPLAPSVAPGLPVVGARLPSTPLDHLLLQAFAAARPEGWPALLAMAGGGPRGEPSARKNDEAKSRLQGISDALLLHDRDSAAGCDATEVMHAGVPRILRRGAGFVPLPVMLPAAGPSVLALGGDLRNSVCVTLGDQAFLGPPGGDLDGMLAAGSLVEGAQCLAALLGVKPAVLVHDLHPDWWSSRIARQLAEGPFRGARLLAVEHQHAHLLSCLAENGATGPALGIVLDGTGYGADGESRGGEILLVDGLKCERLARIAPLRLPGGDLAVRAPWRIAVASACELGAGSVVPRLVKRWPTPPVATVDTVLRLCRGGGELPTSSSAERLFDAAAAILGVRDENSYDGEAATALELAAGAMPEAGDLYPAPLDAKPTPMLMDTRPILGAVLDDVLRGADASSVAARFHATVVDLFARAAEEASRRSGVRTVALSGSLLRNRILLRGLPERLAAAGFTVLTHADIPPDDGGLAFGQAWAGVLSRQGSSPAA